MRLFFEGFKLSYEGQEAITTHINKQLSRLSVDQTTPSDKHQT